MTWFVHFSTWLRSHRTAAWILILIYAAAVTFPHEQVQRIVNAIADRLTRPGVYRLFAGLALAQIGIFTWIVMRRLAKHPARRMLFAFWIATLALIWSTWRFGTANNVELVHYPQYLPEGAALAALTLSPAESLAWVALFGGLDESYQYTYLTGGRRVPLDFNDIYMDLLGGAAGVVLAMSLLGGERARGGSWKGIFRRPGMVMIGGIAAAGVILWSTGAMVLYDEPGAGAHWFALSHIRMPAFWFQVEANGPNKYHTLSPIEGPILILATIGLYSMLDGRVKIAARSEAQGDVRK